MNFETDENYLTAATVDAGILPGWPRVVSNFAGLYPTAYDIDGDGIDEVFADEQNGAINVYRATGEPFPGFPTSSRHCLDAGVSGGQQAGSFAIGDIDDDGDDEVVAVSRRQNSFFEACIKAFEMDGTPVVGFPIPVPDTRRGATITLGDVDGDESLEIVYVSDRSDTSETLPPELLIFSGNGNLERIIPLAGRLLFSATASSLADMDNDGVPEILVLTEGTLNVVRGDGVALDGFPVVFAEETPGQSLPTLQNCGIVVGDIDGDQSPDIVFCALQSTGQAELWAFDSRGFGLADSPLLLSTDNSLPRGPAIADVDNDGRSEVVVANSSVVWMLRYGANVPSGPVLWGQWGRDSRNSNRYR